MCDKCKYVVNSLHDRSKWFHLKRFGRALAIKDYFPREEMLRFTGNWDVRWMTPDTKRRWRWDKMQLKVCGHL